MISKQNFKPIIESINPSDERSLDLTYLPSSYQMLLNYKGEVQIGDTIIWFNNGLKHYIPNGDETRLMEVKTNPAISVHTSTYRINRVSFGKSQTEERIELEIGELDARHQRAFNYRNDPNSRRKFVHELYAFYDNVIGTPYGYTFSTILYLKIKLEWLSSKGWKIAGDQRDITYNISYSLKFYFTPYIVATPPTGYHTGTLVSSSVIRRTSQLDLVIFQTSGHHDNEYPDPLYDVEISGSIYQKITSDFSTNAWTNSGYPLW